ncbi:hypothetical protein SM124_13800 [Bacillus sp. 31A1R]|uniref:DUF2157 domain-containing protein n=1 Tax=Robertmurraya mangrovi TaxID=3098077 RepID=A0ABU5J0B5_9BACI|nr:hypothetical protein [Bacillus sp. 31A1R]MDZ5472802.1 hypothetical protein [Bacillus sp. 31A1R]
MEPLSRDDRKRIVKEELGLLKEKRYISENLYNHVVQTQRKFYEDLEAEEARTVQHVATSQIETNSQVEEEKEKVQPQKQVIVKPAPVKKEPVKKVLSSEQIRERNITWLLNLGVILLLIGGLYVATSKWETLTDWMKASSIAFVSILFFGMAFVSGRVLRIEKTAFAFNVLGSLFLPIFLLSIGWFELLGSYLSFNGEGRFVFGVLSSYAVLPVYIWLAKKLSSRLFVWFSYLALTVGTGYLLAAVQLEKDGFYLGIMIFNGLLLAGYHRLKNNESIKLFTKELVYFAQINLVLTTLLMLLFYSNEVFFGFNLILTAILYLSVVYVTGKKEFHFVFSAMMVYGIYQMVEHTMLDSFSPILYALIGIGFLALPKVLDEQYPWEKVFNWTSAVISFFAFLYITFEGLLLKMGEPSFVLLLGYLVITANFLYLTNVFNRKLFAYLTPTFLSAALLEVVLLIDSVLAFESLLLPVFFIGFVLFVGVGIYLNNKHVNKILASSRDIGLVIMYVTIVVTMITSSWWELGLMLILLAGSLYLSIKLEERLIYKVTTPWFIPFLIGLAVVAFGEELNSLYYEYSKHFGLAVHFALGSFIVLACSYLVKPLQRSSFIVSQMFYTIAILSSFIVDIDEVWVQPSILIVGIGMYVHLYKFTKIKELTYLVSVTVLVAYFTVLHSIHLLFIETTYFDYIQFVGGAILLLSIGYTLRLKDADLFKGFALIGHIYLPLALIWTFLSYWEHAVWSFILAIGIYAVSTKMVNQEWKVRSFLYSGFTSLFLTVSTTLMFADGLTGELAFLVTSILIVIFWFLSTDVNKRRTNYYLVPFSILGIFSFVAAYPYDFTAFLLTIGYATGLLLFLHYIKWDFLVIVPLLSVLMGSLEFSWNLDSIYQLSLLAGLGVILLLVSQYAYKSLLVSHSNFPFKYVDAYSVVSLLFFMCLYLLDRDFLFVKVLPGVLIVLTLWLQRKRVPYEWSWIPAFLAGAYLLEPYYSLLSELEIPALLEREAYVLPFVALIIYLQTCLKNRYKEITGKLQWGILIAVSLTLVQDGLESNTIYDALIVGSLSLISLLAGVFLRIKSYFFVGSGVLLLNVFLQTRPFWGNLPWWAYLLIAGSILIGVASYNEWQKQKVGKGEKTFLLGIKEKVISKLKQWD